MKKVKIYRIDPVETFAVQPGVAIDAFINAGHKYDVDNNPIITEYLDVPDDWSTTSLCRSAVRTIYAKLHPEFGSRTNFTLDYPDERELRKRTLVTAGLSGEVYDVDPDKEYSVRLHQNEKGLYCRINNRPDINGHHVTGKVFFIDNSWTNATEGSAIVRVTKDLKNYGFVKGIMSNEMPIFNIGDGANISIPSNTEVMKFLRFAGKGFYETYQKWTAEIRSCEKGQFILATDTTCNDQIGYALYQINASTSKVVTLELSVPQLVALRADTYINTPSDKIRTKQVGEINIAAYHLMYMQCMNTKNGLAKYDSIEDFSSAISWYTDLFSTKNDTELPFFAKWQVEARATDWPNFEPLIQSALTDGLLIVERLGKVHDIFRLVPNDGKRVDALQRNIRISNDVAGWSNEEIKKLVSLVNIWNREVGKELRSLVLKGKILIHDTKLA